MEAALLLGLLGYGIHSYLDHNDDKVETQTIYSLQTTKEISNFGTDDTRAKNMAMIDWDKKGNFKVGDSPQTGVQWVFVTGD